MTNGDNFLWWHTTKDNICSGADTVGLLAQCGFVLAKHAWVIVGMSFTLDQMTFRQGQSTYRMNHNVRSDWSRQTGRRQSQQQVCFFSIYDLQPLRWSKLLIITTVDCKTEKYKGPWCTGLSHCSNARSTILLLCTGSLTLKLDKLWVSLQRN